MNVQVHLEREPIEFRRTKRSTTQKAKGKTRTAVLLPRLMLPVPLHPSKLANFLRPRWPSGVVGKGGAVCGAACTFRILKGEIGHRHIQTVAS